MYCLPSCLVPQTRRGGGFRREGALHQGCVRGSGRGGGGRQEQWHNKGSEIFHVWSRARIDGAHI
jgi:hypothetical protein